MFKLLVLFVVLGICLARPSVIGAAPYLSYGAPLAAVAYQEPALATVGAVLKTVPTSVSHSSHAVVHKSDHVVQDHLSPVVKTTYTAPLSYSTYAAAPVSYTLYGAASRYAYSA